MASERDDFEDLANATIDSFHEDLLAILQKRMERWKAWQDAKLPISREEFIRRARAAAQHTQFYQPIPETDAEGKPVSQ